MVTIIDSEPATGVFVGIDWGGSHHQVCVVDDAGTIRAQHTVEHTVPGHHVLDELLQQCRTSGPVRVAIERAEGVLVEHLLARGERVYCISPKISARARERYRLANTKSDAFDAFVLADTLRHEHAHWRPLSKASPETAAIAAMCRDRERFVVMQRAVESRLRATLEAYHPAPLHLFSSLDRDITLAFIRDYPNPDAARRVGEDRMRRFCARHGYSGRVEPAVLVQRLHPHLLTGAEGTVTGKQATALMLVDQLDLLNQHLRRFDHTLRPLVAGHPDGPLFTSFPGIGTVIAATMIGEMGDDRARFPSTQALLAEAGLPAFSLSALRARRDLPSAAAPGTDGLTLPEVATQALAQTGRAHSDRALATGSWPRSQRILMSRLESLPPRVSAGALLRGDVPPERLAGRVAG